jgi:hypothetical protein
MPPEIVFQIAERKKLGSESIHLTENQGICSGFCVWIRFPKIFGENT